MSDEINLTHFRDLLQIRLAELQSLECAAQSRDSVELDQSKVGRLSRMDALQQQAMLDANRERGRRERLRIEAAFRRIYESHYGYCAQCDEPIALGRLNFDPATPLCIECANKTDHNS
ncbi:molecular chaperone DnaK [Ectopseudomonas toyotomiensis]|jgi:DnaK suppressor protein|uniref:Transcriptional regulator, TraR/DksA family n=1 Tax=Ectopseudomonas toyotomiensis TaxID=554344 RepID=A0A1I5XDD7_9GAMM|nr:TraR/DksA C4-type zinc finger protein [Pseudomonas toyotomiensis]PIA67052.1 molecular chaperone DnaK [Pseudomonas toyotomiensis]SFQ29995.1 transcriptional regulator, TraR/DksA family [Pseudomonas toyotomiensis]|tara:strand:+ start:8502 stop:8855 length:354 start_codon:yes stop_codon:yes gene_type:complete